MKKKVGRPKKQKFEEKIVKFVDSNLDKLERKKAEIECIVKYIAENQSDLTDKEKLEFNKLLKELEQSENRLRGLF